jgi:phosphonate transport system substrate-binding protein
MRIIAISIFTILTTIQPLSADISLKFGVYTADKPTAVVKQFRPILNAIAAKMTTDLNEKVFIKMQVSKDYAKGIQSIVKGDVDFFRSGPASYILAKNENPDLSILAVENNKGTKRFNGIICVAKDSPITKITDLKGKRFAFGNSLSTIGKFLSQLYLFQHGIKASDLRQYEYLKRHDMVGNAVAIGNFDAGALKESTFNKLVKGGKQIRALASFPNVTKPWIAKSALSKAIRKAITDALISLKDPKILKSLKKDGFLYGSDEDYEIIRVAMGKNDKFFE